MFQDKKLLSKAASCVLNLFQLNDMPLKLINAVFLQQDRKRGYYLG